MPLSDSSHLCMMHNRDPFLDCNKKITNSSRRRDRRRSSDSWHQLMTPSSCWSPSYQTQEQVSAHMHRIIILCCVCDLASPHPQNCPSSVQIQYTPNKKRCCALSCRTTTSVHRKIIMSLMLVLSKSNFFGWWHYPFIYDIIVLLLLTPTRTNHHVVVDVDRAGKHAWWHIGCRFRQLRWVFR